MNIVQDGYYWVDDPVIGRNMVLKIIAIVRTRYSIYVRVKVFDRHGKEIAKREILLKNLINAETIQRVKPPEGQNP